jgi:pimeloyl-ACP methyl ester carboxylesterase
MSHIQSSDGTRIAFTARGEGPALVLVGGALDDGAENEPLARELSRSFTVVNYARRGRGGSGDTPPYTVAREIEDLAALVTTVGGEASIFAASSGGPLALEAAAVGLPITRLALYDVPYAVAAHDVARWRDYRAALSGADPERALELFMRLAGSPEPAIEEARRSEMWPGLLALAPTLAYDAACLGDGAPPAQRLAKVVQPTLVISGADSGPFFAAAADAVAAALPAASRLRLAGSGHVADPVLLGRRLERFLLDGREGRPSRGRRDASKRS